MSFVWNVYCEKYEWRNWNMRNRAGIGTGLGVPNRKFNNWAYT